MFGCVLKLEICNFKLNRWLLALLKFKFYPMSGPNCTSFKILTHIPKLTFDLHLDGLHRHEPWYIINIPTKLDRNWTPLPEVMITSCTICHCIVHRVHAHMYIVYGHFSETLTKTLTKFKRL